MTTTLHEAIIAARNGETERAQRLAAEIIQDNPDDANAWYLLSQLVDSDARRAAYLGKVLALAPNHERARAELDALPPELAESLSQPGLFVPVAEEAPAYVPSSPEPWDVETPFEEVQPTEVPEWLAQPAAEVEAPAPLPVMPPSIGPAAEPVAQPAIPPPVAPAPRPTPKAAPPPPPPRRQNNGALTALLVLLGLLTLIVLAFLVYLLFF